MPEKPQIDTVPHDFETAMAANMWKDIVGKEERQRLQFLAKTGKTNVNTINIHDRESVQELISGQRPVHPLLHHGAKKFGRTRDSGGIYLTLHDAVMAKHLLKHDGSCKFCAHKNQSPTFFSFRRSFQTIIFIIVSFKMWKKQLANELDLLLLRTRNKRTLKHRATSNFPHSHMLLPSTHHRSATLADLLPPAWLALIRDTVVVAIARSPLTKASLRKV